MDDRWRHHRTRDHFGIDSDLYVVLSEPIGPFAAGTPIHHVIDALVAGQAALESGNHQVSNFNANAVLHGAGGLITIGGTSTGAFSANSIIKTATPRSFDAFAWVVMGGTFTANAVIRGAGSFTANAILA